MIFLPRAASLSRTNSAASSRDENVPASTHSVSSGSLLTFSEPSSRYSLFRSVISSSPRADGSRVSARSQTRES